MPVPSTRTLFYRPSAAEADQTPDSRFRRFVNEKHGLALRDYWELHRWSITEVNDFWVAVWEFTGVLGEKSEKLFDPTVSLTPPHPTLISARLNLAENFLLAHPHRRSSHPAIISTTEPLHTSSPPTFLRSLSFEELYQETKSVAASFRAWGVGPGDRVVAFAPSNAEAVVACLAAASLGAVWSSCPSEFGVPAVLERFVQIEPKVLITADFYRYNGQKIPIFDMLVEILAALPSVQHVAVVGHLKLDREPEIAFPPDSHPGRKWKTWVDVVREGEKLAGAEIPFWRGPAMAPVYVLYSSGTTGKPKAIVHTVGGMVLASKMANALHSGLGPQDCFLQFSTLGWMMWNYCISTLGGGGTICVYDGSPLAPQSVLFRLVDEYGVTALGVSPRYLQVLDSAGYVPKQHHRLTSLRMIATAGSVLKAELYDWVRENVGEKVWINNGSGGTDICNLFVGGCPSLPVYHAEIQVPALGMALEAWDDEGNPVQDAQGNMVITTPFPNMPLTFWGEDGDARYKAAYFEEFKTPVWCQGDWIEISSLTGGVVIFGRSDGVLNPQGVRFGTSELYAVVEEMKSDVDDCIAVAQKTPDGDERVVLFVKPKDAKLSNEVVQRIRLAIKAALSSRHVPAKIIELEQIPYTTNGKRMEVPVKKILNGIPFEKMNLSSAENPECLRVFVDHPELRFPTTTTKAKL